MKIKWKKLLVILLAAALFAVNIKSFADEAESQRFSILSVSGSEAFLTRNSREIPSEPVQRPRCTWKPTTAKPFA